MKNQNLIIYNFKELYHIFNELRLELNFHIIEISNEVSLNKEVDALNNYLILSKSNKLNFQNKILIEKFPIRLFKLIENKIEFLKFNLVANLKLK